MKEAQLLRDEGRLLRPVVGCSIDSRMESRIAVAALDNAVARRKAESLDVADCVLHTDRGSPLRSKKLSTSSTVITWSDPWSALAQPATHAAMESFFSLLQTSVLDRRTGDTRDELRIAIVTWIERTYHRRRRQANLGRSTPVEYGLIMTPAATQAAQPRLSPDRAANPGAV